MPSRGIAIVKQHLGKLPSPESLTLAERRAQYERAEHVFPTPPEVKVERVSVPIAPAEWVRPASTAGGAVILYLHGGGYVLGSPRSHRHLAAAIAAASGASALLLDYRLAPEHRFPAAIEDATAAYRWLLDQSIEPRRIAVAGDSAGGGLTVATLLALRDRGVPLAACAVCLSPWVDLTCTGTSYWTRATADPIVQRSRAAEMAMLYLAGADPKHPLASPLHGDLSGLPPLLVQVGADEVLLDDARGLVDRAKAVGVDATLEVWDGMIHVWHWFSTMLDESDQAIARIGEFVRARTR